MRPLEVPSKASLGELSEYEKGSSCMDHMI